jgi:hypothetical protein
MAKKEKKKVGSISGGVKFHHRTEEEQAASFKHARRQASLSEKFPQPNYLFAKENQQFRGCCELASIPPTSRQASKFRNKIGKAYALRNDWICLSSWVEINEEFRECCTLADVAPTILEAYKFNQQKGEAYAILQEQQEEG